MAGIDLGKQVGPLPLGAWVAVVGAGLGIAVYTRRQSGTAAPTVVEDTSGTPGVGVGGSGLWTDITTPTTGQPTAETYTDNDAWGTAAINKMVALGYPSALVYSAITKALAGGAGDNKLSVQEYAIWAQALIVMKAPPYPVSIPAPPTTTPPTTTPTTPAAGQRMHMQWVTSKVGVPNESLRTKQWNIAKQACAARVWCPSSASFNAILAQAQIRSGVGNVNGILKVGRTVTLYRPVPY